MSATIMSDPMAIPGPEPQPAPVKLIAQIEVELAKCDCCGLTEEYTIAYIERVKERYNGTWICGLCAEAVKDEILRSNRLISTEEAMNLHMNFCKKFKSSGPPADSTVDLITAMRHILRRSLVRSTPSSPIRKVREIPSSVLSRSESCMSSLSG